MNERKRCTCVNEASELPSLPWCSLVVGRIAKGRVIRKHLHVRGQAFDAAAVVVVVAAFLRDDLLRFSEVRDPPLGVSAPQETSAAPLARPPRDEGIREAAVTTSSPVLSNSSPLSLGAATATTSAAAATAAAVVAWLYFFMVVGTCSRG